MRMSKNLQIEPLPRQWPYCLRSFNGRRGEENVFYNFRVRSEKHETGKHFAVRPPDTRPAGQFQSLCQIVLSLRTQPPARGERLDCCHRKADSPVEQEREL